MKVLEKLYLNISKSKISKIRLFLTLADTLNNGTFSHFKHFLAPYRTRDNPCKIRTGILVGSCRNLLPGSRRDFGRQDFSSRRESRQDPGKILTRKQKSRQPKSRQDPAANLAKIVAGKQKSWRPKSRQDPAVNLAKILAEKQNSRRPKSQRDPAAKLTKILAGKQ